MSGERARSWAMYCPHVLTNSVCSKFSVPGEVAFRAKETSLGFGKPMKFGIAMCFLLL